MSAYQTEEEQVEAIKKWWKENGKSVVTGVVLGLVVVGGGKGWMEYNRMQAETGSAYYEDFLATAEKGEVEQAATKTDTMIEEQGVGAYTEFAALGLAKMHYQAGDVDEAISRLQWVVDNAEDEAIKQLAQLRLARVLLDTNALDKAAALSAAVTSGEFAGEFSQIAGDVAVAKGDLVAAKSAYEKALSLGVADENLLRMKITSVGG